MAGAAPELDLVASETVADPYPVLDALREQDHMAWARLDSWLIGQSHDVAAALRDERFSFDRVTPRRRARLSGPDADPGVLPAFAVLEDWMVGEDPPDHGRLRRLISRTFTPRAVRRVGGRIVISTGLLLLFAGHGTTTNLIDNGLLALLLRPEDAAAVHDGGGPTNACVDELLRLDGPTKTIMRLLRAGTGFRGRRLRAVERVFLAVVAANRDPRVFERPGVLDLRRRRNPKLGFGAGLHYRRGVPSARLEGSIAIPGALRRLPGLVLAGEELRRPPVLPSRGLHALLATFGGRAA